MNPPRIGDTIHYTRLAGDAHEHLQRQCWAAIVCKIGPDGTANLRVFEPDASRSFGVQGVPHDRDAIGHDPYEDATWFNEDIARPATWHHTH